MITELQMSTIGGHFPVLINKGYAGFREMTARNEVVVDVAGTSHGSTVLLFACRRHLVLQKLGDAGLQAITAWDENVHVLEIARAPALGTLNITRSWMIPCNYFCYFSSNILLWYLASLCCFLRGET